MQSKWRLETSLEGQVESKLRLEGGKWRLEGDLQGVLVAQALSDRDGFVRAECTRECMIYTRIYLILYIYIHIHIYIYICVCVCVYMYVCVCVYVCIIKVLLTFFSL